MAETKSDIKNKYPLPIYNYRVVVGDKSMSFTEISGVSVEHKTATYRHGLSFLEGESIVQYSHNNYQTVTLKKGSVRGISFLHEWMHASDSFFPTNDGLTRSMQISLCDEEGVAVISWHLRKVVPVKLDAPTFDVNSNDVAIESLEVMAASISLEYHD